MARITDWVIGQTRVQLPVGVQSFTRLPNSPLVAHTLFVWITSWNRRDGRPATIPNTNGAGKGYQERESEKWFFRPIECPDNVRKDCTSEGSQSLVNLCNHQVWSVLGFKMTLEHTVSRLILITPSNPWSNTSIMNHLVTAGHQGLFPVSAFCSYSLRHWSGRSRLATG